MTAEEMREPCREDECSTRIPHVKGKHVPYEEWEEAHAAERIARETVN